MAIVHERHNAAKPTQVDPKTGRPLPSSGPPRAASPVLDAPSDGNAGGFFGSFFPRNKKKAAAMEAPPAQLKASGTLSEKEANEVEVISECCFLGGLKSFITNVDQNSSSHHTLTSRDAP